MAKKASSKTVKKAAKKTAVKKTVAKKATATQKTPAAKTAATKKTAVKKTAVKKTAVKKTAVKKAAARKVASKPVVTEVVANADTGFGNELYIRGNGGGLSWESGIPMTNTETDKWVWRTAALNDDLEFKLLINDVIWSQGENFLVVKGQKVTVDPTF